VALPTKAVTPAGVQVTLRGGSAALIAEAVAERLEPRLQEAETAHRLLRLQLGLLASKVEELRAAVLQLQAALDRQEDTAA
jgi:hypothetical protein